MEIKGKFNTAICYAKVIEDAAIEQIKRMCDYPMSEGSRIRIMPDVHAGKGCTIGTTMTINDKVVPNIVGVDIGCGMYTVNLGKEEIDLQEFDKVVSMIPSSMNVWEEKVEDFNIKELRCYDKLENIDWLERSLGTLGGGNHFIEIDRASDGTNYLVIHSGSRNLGKQVAEIYQKTAIDLYKIEKAIERDTLIEDLKEKGRSKDIQAALQELSQLPTPDDLCYLWGKSFEDYLHDIVICQRFAKRNREIMAEFIISQTKKKAYGAFHTIHNYIDTSKMILRKGSISAEKGEKVLIPINMRDGSILAVGKSNPEWNYSAPHGAGRIMSRAQAKNTLSLKAYKEAMQGIYTSSVCENTKDEAPMAYKSLDDIVDYIKDTVDIIEVIKPIYNFKAKD